MKYYFDLLSQPSRAIYIFLKKNKIMFQEAPISIAKGQQTSPDFVKINPLKVVPALEDNDFKLGESIAIFRYLVNKYKDDIPDYWYPKEAKKQAKVDEYLEWQHSNTRYNCAMYFLNKLFIPLMARCPPDKNVIKEWQKKMETVLDSFENVWLKDQDYIAGDEISIADIMAICELQQPGIVGYNVLEGRPKLTAWHQRVSHELGPELNEASVAVKRLKFVFPILNIWLVYGGKIMRTLGLSKKTE